MKNLKNKYKIPKTIGKKWKILCAVFGICLFGYVFGEDVISQIIPTDEADGPGSSGSYIETGTGSSEAIYINKGNNSTVIGNYFQGYYYDSLYGFFRLDEPGLDADQKVRIVGSTGKCATGYGYKLGGYGYSTTMGLIDFDYNSSTFVYYCESDKVLHGYAYNDVIGLQNFEGIGFEIIPNISTTSEATGTGVFVNDVTSINDIVTYTGATSNYDYNTIGGDIINIDATEESIFYIIK